MSELITNITVDELRRLPVNKLIEYDEAMFEKYKGSSMNLINDWDEYKKHEMATAILFALGYKYKSWARRQARALTSAEGYEG